MRDDKEAREMSEASTCTLYKNKKDKIFKVVRVNRR